MSQYYKIKGLKVRISDHEPYTSLNGSSDIYLYVKSADNRLLSVEEQLEYICEKRGYNISDFKIIIDEWTDGTYDKDVFAKKDDDDDDEIGNISEGLNGLSNNLAQTYDEKLRGHYLPRSAKHPEINALSEATGVSRVYIKKHFNIY
jgi:hypothetical protein